MFMFTYNFGVFLWTLSGYISETARLSLYFRLKFIYTFEIYAKNVIFKAKIDLF